MRFASDGDGRHLEADRRHIGFDDLRPGIDPPAVATSSLLEVSNAVVRLYKQVFGRGPTHARTRFAGPDTLVVLLQDTMTASERRLASQGGHERLREHRLLLHETMEDEIRALVERILERRTMAVIGGIDTIRDVAAEVFLLAPEPAPGPDAGDTT